MAATSSNHRRTKRLQAVKPRYFTHFWGREQWDCEAKSEAGLPCDHTAGNRFRSRKIRPCDVVYIVSLRHGILSVAGRMAVDLVCGKAQARKYLKRDNLWDADDHLVTTPNRCTVLNFELQVPRKVISRIRLLSKGEQVSPSFTSPGVLNGQTFRSIRELTRQSAELLDAVLARGNSTKTKRRA